MTEAQTLPDTDTTTEALAELGQHIAQRLGDAVLGQEIAFGELTLTVAATRIVQVAGFLKSDPTCAFSTLVDITAADWPGRAERFEVIYHFLSMYRNHRIRVKAGVADGTILPSIIEVHPSANWFEREIFDMFGIAFSGHPDLRRLLTDYGFRGHPMRKDFPTTGHVEVRYDEVQKRVVYEPVSLVQEYRQFDFMSPWEGAKYILPGDEKNDAGKAQA
ncbi:MAG: NADH-quinone oxidoreductase subunit C [Rubellimicrobium sp.]|nr:NADH-quinone oxidoreductase subunit C [Rubellimicrobium sp.]